MFNLFKRKYKPQDERNPMLDVDHECDWLDANAGLEKVCGICGRRQWISKEPKPKGYNGETYVKGD